MTSQYAYLYNQYPFSNDPNAGLLHPDWWITECACVPQFTTPSYEPATPFRPMKFYDEERLLLAKTYKAGETIRLTAPAGVAWTVIDLIDTELVGQPVSGPVPSNVLDFGADRRGGRTPRRRSKRRSRPRRHRAAPSTSRRGRTVSTATSSSTTSRSRARGTGTRRSRAAKSRSPSRRGRLAAHRRRVLRKGCRGRRQPQRPPVGVRHRGRRARADRHRPGERHRRGVPRLVVHRPAHPAHQGRAVVRRTDVERRRRATTSSSTRSRTR